MGDDNISPILGPFSQGKNLADEWKRYTISVVLLRLQGASYWCSHLYQRTNPAPEFLEPRCTSPQQWGVALQPVPTGATASCCQL